MRKKNRITQPRRIERKIAKEPINFSTPDKQLKLAKVVASMKSPAIFSAKHHPFIDFKKFNLPQPIYITLIRDPIERVISWFNYVRTDLYKAQKSKKYKDLIEAEGRTNWYRKTFEACVLQGNIECQYLPLTIGLINDHKLQAIYFCGTDYACMVFNSKKVVQKAKQNVEKYFTVVGSWEDTNITLTVLENYLPRYFKGAMEVYYENPEKWRKINRNDLRPKVSEEIKDIVRKNFTWEIDFYKFCKQRLYKQYIALQLDKVDVK